MRLLRTLIGLFYSSDKAIPADKGTHLTYIAIIVPMLVLPFFMGAATDDGAGVSLVGVEIPSTCPSRSLFGVTCPGCGLTRSFVLLTKGRFGDSLRLHRVGLILYAFFLYQLVFRIACIARSEITTSAFWQNAQHYSALAVIGLLLANWLAGLFAGGNGW